MAISYAPAQGFDARVYQNLGASEAAQANRDYALRASALAQEAGNRSSQLALQREEFEARQQPSQRDYFQAGQQQNEQAMQIAGQMSAIDLRAKYDSLALTQAEEQRMGRLNRQADYVRSNTGPGKQFNEQDGQAMLAELYTGINPMQRRQQQAAIALTQAQTQAQMDAHARDTAQGALRDRFRGQALENGTIEHKDENGQTWAITYPTGVNDFHTVVRPRQQGGNTEITPQIMARFVSSARSEQSREEQFAARSGQPAPAWAASPQLREADRQRRVNEMVADHSGTGGGTRADAATQNDQLNALGQSIIQRLTPRVTPQPQQPIAVPQGAVPPQSSADVPL